MRLPYWLLRLLPMWNYVCPRCQKEVSKNSHECRWCGERYGVPLRVPPKVLKDKKALEDYVHREIFPKISAQQRDYLTRFFTEIFSDGFESGNFNAWTGTEGSPEVVSTYAHHGTKSCKINAEEGVYKDLGASYSTVYMRGYARFDDLPWAEYFRSVVLRLGNSGAWANPLDAEAYHDGTSAKWTLRNAYQGTQDISTLEVQTGVWYCVEIKFVYNTGSCLLYIDGVQVATVGNFPIQANRAGVGGVNGLSCTYYIDCIKVADTGPIGLEAEVTYINVSDSTSGAEALLKLRNIAPITDLGGGTEVVTRPQREMLLTETGTGAEIIGKLRNVATILDSILGAESVFTAKEFMISDSGLGAEAVSRPERRMTLTDSGTGAETITRPERQMTITDLANCLEALFKLRELAAVTDGAAGLELVTVGVAGVIKTKIFLILGDLAIQLTGD